ncbi:MAG: tripartite tricarboxylate transporter substrate binding protein, partial [Comamonadaceae bacterium]
MPYRLTLAAGLTALLSSLANPVLAAWPERAITLIVPGAPGGTTDIPTRLLGQKMSAALGVPVVVENRAGSGGIIGAQQAMRAAPDGYTLVMGNTGSHAINYSAYKNLAYAPTDFVPITDMISFTNVLVVGPASPYTRVADIVAAMKQRPGTVTNASAGIGQTTHLTGEMFKIRTGVQGVHVPYKGSTPATMSVMSGETAFMFDNLTQSLPQIQAGKLRALAVTSAQRSADLPDTPTMK